MGLTCNTLFIKNFRQANLKSGSFQLDASPMTNEKFHNLFESRAKKVWYVGSEISEKIFF